MRRFINAINWEMASTILYALVAAAAVLALMFDRQMMRIFQ